jgi:hypothetical protein
MQLPLFTLAVIWRPPEYRLVWRYWDSSPHTQINFAFYRDEQQLRRFLNHDTKQYGKPEKW